MTTKTTTPADLAERAAAARAEADNLAAEATQLQRQLDTEQRALVERRRIPVNIATAAAVREALAAIDAPKTEPRPWVEVLADPTVGLDGLFVAWCEMRSLAACRAKAVEAGGNILNAVDPRFGEDGNPLPWRRDTHDRMADTLFLPEVQAALDLRVAAAAGQASQTIAAIAIAIANDAGNAAAAKIN
jgi:hypothetical protein